MFFILLNVVFFLFVIIFRYHCLSKRIKCQLLQKYAEIDKFFVVLCAIIFFHSAIQEIFVYLVFTDNKYNVSPTVASKLNFKILKENYHPTVRKFRRIWFLVNDKLCDPTRVTQEVIEKLLKNVINTFLNTFNYILFFLNTYNLEIWIISYRNLSTVHFFYDI